MSIHISFNPNENLIYLLGKIHGPKGSRMVNLALDTGATTTLVSTDIIEALGYQTSTENKTRLIMGGGVDYAPQVQVRKMVVAGQQVKNLTVTCFSLPQESGLDGLLGLNFLRYFDIEINYSNSTLILKPLPLA